MAVTLPIEVYEAFEKGLGKEDAKMVVKSLETTIGDISANTWEKTKNELYDHLVSKEEFNELKEEFKSFREEVRVQINEINRKIDFQGDSLDQKIDETNKRIYSFSDSINQKIDETNNRFDSLSDSINQRIDETNKRIDSVMKIQLWIMGLIAVQAVAVIIKLIFS